MTEDDFLELRARPLLIRLADGRTGRCMDCGGGKVLVDAFLGGDRVEVEVPVERIEQIAYGWLIERPAAPDERRERPHDGNP